MKGGAVKAVVGLLCLVPLAFASPRLFEPFGQAEEALNGAIWGLGARAILREGPIDARLGAKVAPYPGAQGGIYAHHPPLPVWGALVPVALGGGEAGVRLLGLGSAALALLLFYRLLREVASAPVALVGQALAATTPFVLVYGRLYTTLTLATPLVLALTLLLLRLHRKEGRASLGAAVLVAALVFSSWDGVLFAAAASVLFAVASRRRGLGRALVLPAAFAVSALALGLYLHWANGGLAVLAHQFRYRSSDEGLHLAAFLSKQAGFLAQGLGGPLLVISLGSAAALLAARRFLEVGLVALLALPGVGMTLVFQHGANHHAFWAYNTFLPAAAAVALGGKLLLERWPKARIGALGLALLGLHLALGLPAAHAALEKEARHNLIGAQLPLWFPRPGARLPMFAHQAFHPYVTWTLGVPPDVALGKDALAQRLASGEWRPDAWVLADAEFAARVGCQGVLPKDANPRWAHLTALELHRACLPGQ